MAKLAQLGMLPQLDSLRQRPEQPGLLRSTHQRWREISVYGLTAEPQGAAPARRHQQKIADLNTVIPRYRRRPRPQRRVQPDKIAMTNNPSAGAHALPPMM